MGREGKAGKGRDFRASSALQDWAVWQPWPSQRTVTIGSGWESHTAHAGALQPSILSSHLVSTCSVEEPQLVRTSDKGSRFLCMSSVDGKHCAD